MMIPIIKKNNSRKFIVFNQLLFFIILIAVIPGGCEKTEPLKIGFVGDLTGSMSKLGISGRNGVLLAIEEQNITGGIKGNQIKLITKDDKHLAEQALKVDQELIQEGVVAIIGHMTSTMSVKAISLINKEKILMISPTTSKLSRLDDYFIRLVPDDQTNRYLAQYAYNQLQLKKLAIVYDFSNIAYSKMVKDKFTSEFESSGGKIIISTPFTSSPDLDYIGMIKSLLGSKPDGLLIVGGSLDTAMICQHVRMAGSQLPILLNGWAGTEELIQHGGPALDGIIFPNMYDNDSLEPSFLKFKNKFKKRFGHAPDFAAVYSYEAAQLLLNALSENANPKQLKQMILKQDSLDGLQGKITFDRYGDAHRKINIVTIKKGKTIVLK